MKTAMVIYCIWSCLLDTVMWRTSQNYSLDEINPMIMRNVAEDPKSIILVTNYGDGVKFIPDRFF